MLTVPNVSLVSERTHGPATGKELRLFRPRRSRQLHAYRQGSSIELLLVNARVNTSRNPIGHTLPGPYSGSGDRCTPQLIASSRVLAHIGSYGANRDQLLCQNCVTCPLKPQSNTVIYGDTPMHIVVAGSR